MLQGLRGRITLNRRFETEIVVALGKIGPAASEATKRANELAERQPSLQEEIEATLKKIQRP